MRASIQQRETYHPPVDADKQRGRGQRDSLARLRLIQSKVDFTDKTVLDLGCSGGFFALSVASQAKHVLAVDADRHMVERNRREAERLGYDNVEFVHARIEPDFTATLPHVDVVLFLSVFHHILAASDNYDWNLRAREHDALRTLERINQLADIYVFEMGEPWEPRANWADRVAAETGDLQTWVAAHVFGCSYKSVQALPGVAYRRWPFTWWPNLAINACRTRVGRTLLRQSGIERRDFRTIYIGRRK